jgi:hypothetical protein
MNSKIRTIAVSLVATCSFAFAAVAPSVSQATKNNGAYAKSGAGQKQKWQNQFCGEIHQLWNEAMKQADEAGKEGDTLAQGEMLDTAAKSYELAKSGGCGAWLVKNPAQTFVAPVAVATMIAR